MTEIPPISEIEFRSRFYTCDNLNLPSYIHYLHKCYRLDSTCTKVLALLPKRTSRLDLDTNERTYFWGLYAREAPAVARVFFYTVVCIIPMILFFFMWLFGWKHAADLQNASVPLFATLALLSILWSIILSGFKNAGRQDDAV
jgi:hypothetical protein